MNLKQIYIIWNDKDLLKLILFILLTKTLIFLSEASVFEWLNYTWKVSLHNNEWIPVLPGGGLSMYPLPTTKEILSREVQASIP